MCSSDLEAARQIVVAQHRHLAVGVLGAAMVTALAISIVLNHQLIFHRTPTWLIPALLVLTVAGMGLVWLAPPLFALFGHGTARVCGALAWAGATLSYLPTLQRYRRNWVWALALPLIAVFYTAATVASAVDHMRGRGAVWKNRAYADAGA